MALLKVCFVDLFFNDCTTSMSTSMSTSITTSMSTSLPNYCVKSYSNKLIKKFNNWSTTTLFKADYDNNGLLIIDHKPNNIQIKNACDLTQWFYLSNISNIIVPNVDLKQCVSKSKFLEFVCLLYDDNISEADFSQCFFLLIKIMTVNFIQKHVFSNLK